jgi:hypothetical protein
MRNVVLTQNLLYEFTERMPYDQNKFAALIFASRLIVAPGYSMPTATKKRITKQNPQEASKSGMQVFGWVELTVLKQAAYA